MKGPATTFLVGILCLEAAAILTHAAFSDVLVAHGVVLISIAFGWWLVKV